MIDRIGPRIVLESVMRRDLGFRRMGLTEEEPAMVERTGGRAEKSILNGLASPRADFTRGISNSALQQAANEAEQSQYTAAV